MSAIFDYSSGEGVADAEAENPFTPETQGRVGPPFASKFRNPQQAVLHARESGRGHRNRATLAVARKLVGYLLVVDKSRQPFHPRDLVPEDLRAAALLYLSQSARVIAAFFDARASSES